MNLFSRIIGSQIRVCRLAAILLLNLVASCHAADSVPVTNDTPAKVVEGSIVAAFAGCLSERPTTLLFDLRNAADVAVNVPELVAPSPWSPDFEVEVLDAVSAERVDLERVDEINDSHDRLVFAPRGDLRVEVDLLARYPSLADLIRKTPVTIKWTLSARAGVAPIRPATGVVEMTTLGCRAH